MASWQPRLFATYLRNLNICVQISMIIKFGIIDRELLYIWKLFKLRKYCLCSHHLNLKDDGLKKFD